MGTSKTSKNTMSMQRFYPVTSVGGFLFSAFLDYPPKFAALVRIRVKDFEIRDSNCPTINYNTRSVFLICDLYG
jgi:hypothetical protein